MNRICSTTLVSCIALSMGMPGYGQEITAMDEVVVTDSVPTEAADFDGEGYAASATEGEEFSLWNANTPRDVPDRVPNFFSTDTGNAGYGDIMTMRGVGNTPFFSNPAVVYYVDGVPHGDVFSYSDSFIDVESVEVYRGPQGARFGRNAYGGAVNIITKRPDNEWGGSITTSVGTYNHFGTSGSVSGAIIDDVLKLRLWGFHSERDGFIRNSFLGEDTDDESRSGGGATLYFTPSEDWEISLSASRETWDNGSTRLTTLGSYDRVNSNVRGQVQGDSSTASLRIAYTGDLFDFTSTTARRTWEIDPFDQDIDLGPFPIAFTRIQQDQEQWSQEFRFDSPEDSGSRFEWTLGTYGAFAETNHDGFNPFTGLTTYNQEQEDYAIFAEGGIAVTETFKAIFGLRYDYVHKEMFRKNTLLDPVGVDFGGNWEHVSPSLTLELEAAENLLFYASTAYTYKPGGFSAFENPFIGRAGLAEYKEETNWASEIGVKASGMDGRVRGRAAAFYYDIEDYQVERAVANLTGDYIILNAPEATSYGVEFELQVDIAPGLTFDGSIGVTETELDRFTDPVTGANLSGNEAPFVPEMDWVTGLTWQGESGLFGRIEYRGVGDTYFNDANTPAFRQSSYALLNARVGYRTDKFTVALYGTNLTDEDYYTNINAAVPIPTFTGGGSPGAPLQVGAMVTIEF